MVLKELVDNALDACEEAGIAPEIAVRVDEKGITITDNGPGLPPEVVQGVLDFSVRVSSREAYVAPDRGAQGNALMTITAMPFVLDGRAGRVEIAARGVRHEIAFSVDPIRQHPVIQHERHDGIVKSGTSITVHWPHSALLNVDVGQTALFTNCRRLHMAQPASHSRRLGRRDEWRRPTPRGRSGDRPTLPQRTGTSPSTSND